MTLPASNASLDTAPACAFRIGEGWDTHALVAGRKLILGGVHVPHERGLLGHSDADVLLHAITDALLGAAALGDIGRHFPDTDERFKGADSMVLLAEAASRVRQAGWAIGNIDSTVIARPPSSRLTFLPCSAALPLRWAWLLTRSTSRPRRLKKWGRWARA